MSMPCRAAPCWRRKNLALQRECGLAGGDDYELVFSAPGDAAGRAAVAAAATASGTPVQRIGSIEAEPGLRLHDGAGQALALQFNSFDHFKSP